MQWVTDEINVCEYVHNAGDGIGTVVRTLPILIVSATG